MITKLNDLILKTVSLCRSRFCQVFFLMWTTAAVSHAQNSVPVQSFDIVIAGGSSGAFGAAIGAARSGFSVVLIEDTPVLGGMISNGISNIDCYSYQSLSGVFDEFRQNVREYYTPIMHADPIFRFPKPASAKVAPASADKIPTTNVIERRARQTNEAIHGGRWEPHVADRILKKMADGYPNLKIYYNRYATGVLKNKNTVTGIQTNSKDNQPITFLGKVVIDATHEGDIAAWAGAPYRVGREPRSREEPHAGEIYFYNSTSEIIPGGSGRQDAGMVSYGIRLCIQYYDPAKGTKHIIKRPPPGYDAAKYEYAKYEADKPFDPTMPNWKAEMNKNPIGNELQEVNWSWPEASRSEREKLYEFYKNHALGFLYYLQHVRGIKTIGLANDEFKDNGNIPYRVFTRETRRIEGEIVLNETDINPFVSANGSLTPTFRRSSIAIGHYPIDSKPVHQKTDMSTPDKGEGDFFLSTVISPFQVPYEAIVPKQVEGMLVPVALSATHVAFSAVRMDPTWMVTGQAAGVAAAISVRKNIPVRTVDVQDIQRELLRQKCKLTFYWDVPAEHPHFEAIQKASLKEWIQPTVQRDFYPDSLLTRAQAAQLLVRAFDMGPSVSAIHFSDVSYNHPDFRAIETLFDRGILPILGIEPRWSKVGGYAERNDGFDHRRSNFGSFFPDKAITVSEFRRMIHRLKFPQGEEPEASSGNGTAQPEEALTRASAVSYLVGELEK